MLPTDQQILDLHHKYAQTGVDFDLIFTHSRIVDAIATQLLDAKPTLTINRELLHVGCMLHDIGAYDVIEDGKFVKGVRHGVIGEEILRNEGYPESIWRFASHHTGVGLTPQDIIDQSIPIPAADYTAQTDEERLVMYADKFHSKSTPPDEPPYFCTFEWYRDSTSKFSLDNATKFDELAQMFGKPNLMLLAEQFGYDIIDS
ncbi:MAG: hypothetical protein JWO07_85 [Candidatus Saccharibacteria bacterium]|nr:hypothetical protein [Candidatus Saccharibacteria bacterium]